jgi:ATP adenylyltransferase
VPCPDAPLEAGTLQARWHRAAERALAQGALRPIQTQETIILDGGVHFLVRAVDSLARKASERQQEPDTGADWHPRPDPFLPPEPALTVAALTGTHLAVLNKFNVLPAHLLIVTRHFEHQETLLNRDDMAALALCLRELDGLAFYNGGTVAGASQPHKHLQLVPIPLGRDGLSVPMDVLLSPGGPTTQAQLPPFAHALAQLDPRGLDGARLQDLYLELLGRIGIRGEPRDGALYQSAPYNLLVTRRWLLAVPRRADCVEGISINALGFAGSLFVKDRDQLAAVRRLGPMRMLCGAAGTWAP